MSFVVTSRWTAKEGAEAKVEDVVLRLVESSRGEPGNIVYRAHRDPKDPRVFFFYEEYSDEDSFNAHLDTPHFCRLGRDLATPLLEQREPQFYVPLEAS